MATSATVFDSDCKIILIGPVGVGKSTTAGLLAERLSLPHLALDELRWPYFQEVGYDPQRQQQLWVAEGIAGVLAYWEPFEVHALERALADHRAGVFDVGGGYTIAVAPQLRRRIQAALAPYPYVVLLLPAPDLEDSLRVLAERLHDQLPEQFPMRDHVERHFATRALAKHVVYTGDQTPEAVCEQIVARVSGRVK